MIRAAATSSARAACSPAGSWPTGAPMSTGAKRRAFASSADTTGETGVDVEVQDMVAARSASATTAPGARDVDMGPFCTDLRSVCIACPRVGSRIGRIFDAVRL